jgi:hypothetical protein
MPDLQELLLNYTFEAFRLETLPQYIVDGEWETFMHFKETGIIQQDDDFLEYVNDVKKNIEAGKRHIRTRVTPIPLNDYTIFETKTGYIPLSLIGTEINFITKENFDKIINSAQNKIKDFWLFDKSILVFMDYDDKGRYLGNEMVKDNSLVDQYLHIRNELVNNAITLSNILDRF